MHDVERKAARQPIRDPDRWEALNEMLDDYMRHRANRRAFYKGIVVFGGIAAALAPFHDLIVSVCNTVWKAIRGGN